MIKDVINNIKNRLVTVVNGNEFNLENTLLKYLFDFSVISLDGNEFLNYELFLKNNSMIKNKVNNIESLSNHEKFIDNFKNDENIKILVINSFSSRTNELYNIINNLLDIRSNYSPRTNEINVRFLLLGDFNYELTKDNFSDQYGSWPFTNNNNHFYSSKLKINYFDLHFLNKIYNIDLDSKKWNILYTYSRGYIFDIEFIYNDLKTFAKISSNIIKNICLPYYKNKELSIRKILKKINIKKTSHLFSIKTKDDTYVDEIFRSGIFKLSHIKNRSNIFSLKNYFSEFCLNRYLFDSKISEKLSYPTKYTFKENTDLFQTISRYERLFKQKLNLINKENFNFLDNIMLFATSGFYYDPDTINIKINSKSNIKINDEININFITPASQTRKHLIDFEKEWGKDEVYINDNFDMLTLGDLKEVIKNLTYNDKNHNIISKITNYNSIKNIIDTCLENSILISNECNFGTKAKLKYFKNDELLKDNTNMDFNELLTNSNKSEYLKGEIDFKNIKKFTSKITEESIFYIQKFNSDVHFYTKETSDKINIKILDDKYILFNCLLLNKSEKINILFLINSKYINQRNLQSLHNLKDDYFFIEHLRKYRNAISHNKDLSENSILNFYEECNNYLEILSSEFK